MRKPDRNALPARSLALVHALALGQVHGGGRQQLLGTLDSGGGGGSACAYCSGLAGKPVYH